MTSIARAVAPARRNCSHELATAVEPPVPCTLPFGSNAKLPYIGTSAGELSTRIWLQEASSSSATIAGSPVHTPCPASTCFEMTVTVLSGSIRTNGMTSGLPAATPFAESAAAALRSINDAPSVKPAPASVESFTNVRRVTVVDSEVGDSDEKSWM